MRNALYITHRASSSTPPARGTDPQNLQNSQNPQNACPLCCTPSVMDGPCGSCLDILEFGYASFPAYRLKGMTGPFGDASQLSEEVGGRCRL